MMTIGVDDRGFYIEKNGVRSYYAAGLFNAYRAAVLAELDRQRNSVKPREQRIDIP